MTRNEKNRPREQGGIPTVQMDDEHTPSVPPAGDSNPARFVVVHEHHDQPCQQGWAPVGAVGCPTAVTAAKTVETLLMAGATHVRVVRNEAVAS